MGKAIILSRVSTLGQELVSQTNDLVKDAGFRGYSQKDIILIEDKESAIKLSESERNGLITMKYHIENDQVDCVFIWEITRISRQLPMLYSIRDYLQAHHVQLYCHQPQFTLFNDDWTISDVSNMVFAMFAVLAENEMKTKKARMLRARLNNKTQGKSSGGRPLFGYTTDKNNYFVIDEPNANIIRRIFDDYSTGLKALRKLAKELQAEGYFSNVSFPALVNQLNGWIKNEKYYGNSVYPAIITKELFDKCQSIRLHNTQVKHGHSNNQFLCKGLIYDKSNKHLLSIDGNGDTYRSKKYKGSNVRRENIDPIIWEVASDIYYNRMNDFNSVYNSLMDKMNTLIKKMNVSRENAESIQAKIDKVEERLIFGKISEDKANSIIEELDKSKQKYKLEHSQYMAETVPIQKQMQELMFGSKTVRGNETIEQKIEIVNKTITRIEVFKPKFSIVNIEIHNILDNEVKTYQCNCFTHKYNLVHSTSN